MAVTVGAGSGVGTTVGAAVGVLRSTIPPPAGKTAMLVTAGSGVTTGSGVTPGSGVNGTTAGSVTVGSGVGTTVGLGSTTGGVGTGSGGGSTVGTGVTGTSVGAGSATSTMDDRLSPLASSGAATAALLANNANAETPIAPTMAKERLAAQVRRGT
ncbi:hypothetical protein KPL76_05910 [Subtercola sp. PAMC28395]|uniref:hypothetical protein n=1 Tax=Subtercola sp. PAMC28395 TaxID=2846775 RepID=UPI001C0D63D2|nr:hypothetical protein [Subtercola sp. PAMC28395]QWT24893.1 hypothetical protein KPL76_05910 [Subtercola sp. PAMC28395]